VCRERNEHKRRCARDFLIRGSARTALATPRTEFSCDMVAYSFALFATVDDHLERKVGFD
jgi:hypothetical protein